MTETPEPYEIRLIARLDVRPGDVVVVTIPNSIEAGEAGMIRDQIRSMIPGAKVIMLAGGAGIAVLAPSQVDPAKVPS